MTANPSRNAARGAGAALLAAVAFGATVPATRVAFEGLPASFGSGWLYASSGLGLLVVLAFAPRTRGRLARADVPWFLGSVLCGACVAPYALVRGLAAAPAHLASLLLDLEVVLTALVAVVAFRERLGRRAASAVLLAAVGGAALALVPTAGGPDRAAGAGAGWIVLACFAWALDNNLTRKIAHRSAVALACGKGLLGGALSLAALAASGAWPAEVPTRAWALGGAAGVVGFGASLVLFVLALRRLGAARTSATFSLAPLLGAAASAAFLPDERVHLATLAAAVPLVVGAWLLATERGVAPPPAPPAEPLASPPSRPS